MSPLQSPCGLFRIHRSSDCGRIEWQYHRARHLAANRSGRVGGGHRQERSRQDHAAPASQRTGYAAERNSGHRWPCVDRVRSGSEKAAHRNDPAGSGAVSSSDGVRECGHGSALAGMAGGAHPADECGIAGTAGYALRPLRRTVSALAFRRGTATRRDRPGHGRRSAAAPLRRALQRARSDRAARSPGCLRGAPRWRRRHPALRHARCRRGAAGSAENRAGRWRRDRRRPPRRRIRSLRASAHSSLSRRCPNAGGIVNDLTSEIVHATAQHLLIVGVAMLVATSAGIPIGVACVRNRRSGRIVLRLIDMIQTIPSLALFGFLIPLPLIGGIGIRTAIVALILYSLLPVVRNTVTGIAGVDPLIVEAATALGMTERQRLMRIDLPLALPSIFGGIRIATVIAIGVATIAAAVGGGGLGTLIFRGVAMVDSTRILAGALPAAALAVAADLLFGALERLAARRLGV